MSGDLTATTTVTVELVGRRPTIADAREALDILAAEGIPSTFEVEIEQRVDRKYVADGPREEWPVTFSFRVTAERSAKGPA